MKHLKRITKPPSPAESSGSLLMDIVLALLGVNTSFLDSKNAALEAKYSSS